jgi:hypothetical protein
MSRVLILSLRDDLHAYAIRHELRAMSVDCDYVAVDSLANQTSLSWNNRGQLGLITEGRDLPLEGVNVIWWRRSALAQKTTAPLDDAQVDLINRDWRAALRGSLLADFGGIWVSHPDRTDAAALKPLQLRAAAAVGLRAPRTLMSNEPSQVRAFLNEIGGEAVVKNVSGTLKTVLFAATIRLDQMPSDESIAACPAIYQEKISGTRHLRIAIFGQDIHAAEITTTNLDWRQKLPTEIRMVQLDADLKGRLLSYQEIMGLKMGVVDMKIDTEGNPVWLENNPQGQFLFVEGLTKYPLARHFAHFLREQVNGNNSRLSTTALAF